MPQCDCIKLFGVIPAPEDTEIVELLADAPADEEEDAEMAAVSSKSSQVRRAKQWLS